MKIEFNSNFNRKRSCNELEISKNIFVFFTHKKLNKLSPHSQKPFPGLSDHQMGVKLGQSENNNTLFDKRRR